MNTHTVFALNQSNTHTVLPSCHQQTLQRMVRFNPLGKMDTDYNHDFCGLEQENISHVFCHCVCTRMFWLDVVNSLKRKLKIDVEIQELDVLLYFNPDKMGNEMWYVIKPFIIIGKFHIHKEMD